MIHTESFVTPDISAPRYDLDEAVIQRLADSLLRESQPQTADRFVCYRFSGDDQYSNLGRFVEHHVFNDKFANDSDELAKEYEPYEKSSTFFVVIDQNDQLPVGALRIIRNSENGFKTLNDVTESPLAITPQDYKNYHDVDDFDSLWDIATVVVPKQYREVEKHLVSNILFRAMHVQAMHEDITDYVSIIDVRARKSFELLGFPFTPMNGSEPFEYLGSKDSLAMHGDAQDFAPSVLRNYKESVFYKKPFIYRYAARLALGRGIDDKLQFDFS